jgi:hypothetical protein
MGITSLDKRHTARMETILKYKNENLDEVYQSLQNEFYNDSILLNHRTYIEENNLGYGEKPFHVIWREIINSQPKKFKFLEIGVYKGQVLSLVKLLSDLKNKECEFYGVTPLSNVGDKYSKKYDSVDYALTIESLFKKFNLEFDLNTNIINGSSVEEDVKNKIKQLGIFDVVYIDGCHDYDCVVSDILLIKEITKNGSYIIMDDASCYKPINRIGAHLGHSDVCDAIKDYIENDNCFEEVICVGHNRVFRKIK